MIVLDAVINQYKDSFFIKNNVIEICTNLKIPNPSNIIERFVMIDILTKEKLSNSEKAIVRGAHKSSKQLNKFTISAKGLKIRSNFFEEKDLFKEYKLPMKEINTLLVLLNATDNLTEEEVRNEVNDGLYMHNGMPIRGYVKEMYKSLNDLIKKGYVAPKHFQEGLDESVTYYRITTLGKSIIDLITRVDTSLCRDDYHERKVFDFPTQHKTVLAFPLWG
jgi:hypothetical protein